ncbi:hypothetical protein DOTSEDRAFT_56623 [Dothistroma septosporum NZE10]|uniref:Uncharacterized protein n=1 Tax=Dothistroma septosporum (strain NZE10 / CBS 128990) TaxID=675120 RepID=M2XI40_DOTSN|nr:hypothetical protein DOTSEDRAFT_56623 [Dothistroma septosporum NZE10]
MSINKRKLPSDNGDGHNASKRIKLTNHDHPERERSFVSHTAKDGEVVRSTEYIDFATVVPESITSCHAPDELKTKGERKRWREQMRARAIQAQSQGSRVATTDRGGRNGPKVGVRETGKPSERVDVKRVASTRLARPDMKNWHAVGEYRPVWEGSGDRGAVRSSDAISKAQSKHANILTSAKLRREEQQISQPRRAMPIYRPPGLKRFEDVHPPPRKNFFPLSDSDESSESESDSGEDENEIEEKASVRGSMSESFAERIFAARDDANLPDQPRVDKKESADSAEDLPGPHLDYHIEFAEPNRAGSESICLPSTVVSPVTNRTSDASSQLPPSSSTFQEKTATTSDTLSSWSSGTAAGTNKHSNRSAMRPANMVAKKTLAEAKAGGDHSGNGLFSGRAGKLIEVSSNRMRSRQEFFDVEEEFEDVYDAVEDVTEEILGESVLFMDQLLGTYRTRKTPL